MQENICENICEDNICEKVYEKSMRKRRRRRGGKVSPWMEMRMHMRWNWMRRDGMGGEGRGGDGMGCGELFEMRCKPYLGSMKMKWTTYMPRNKPQILKQLLPHRSDGRLLTGWRERAEEHMR